MRFVDVAADAGIDVVNVSGDPRRWYIPESNGCGAAWLDHDGDGDVDLFVANGASVRYVDASRSGTPGTRLEILHRASSRLYRNDGDLRFTDVTAETGAGRSEWINAVATGDVDGDGDPDLYLANLGADVFLRNDGGRFVDATAASGLANPGWGTGAAFADPDLDGDLDLYVANYCQFDPENPPDGGRRNVIAGVEVAWGPEEENQRGFNPGAPNVFFLGDGAGGFRVATAEAGLALEKALCSYAVVFCDVDLDGLPDLLVANDMQPSNLFHNEGNARFDEQGMERGFALDAAGNATSAMGFAVADVDGDGDFDVLRTNFDFEPNSLHLNDGRGYFTDRAEAFGLARPSVDKLGWGCGFFDAECDGDLDLLIANGHVYPQSEEIGMHPWAQPTQLFEAVADRRLGLVWRDATDRAGPGLEPLRAARGVALGDPDGDGDVDILVVDLDGPPRLLENRSRRQGRWLAVRTVGTLSNRDGYGAIVSVHAGDRVWTREVRTSGGLYSAHDPRLHFGLGDVERVDRVEIRWPSGIVQIVEDPELDRLHTLTEPSQSKLPATEARR
ncbi:MAG: FG-GAP-like repeat-containing protein [Planctomycetota bacterium]|nr:FG-GAP-like repeat-containing protein [Planctomycetota bacterium]